MSAREWFYARDNKQHGPVSGEELKELLASGSLSPDALVWTDGMEDWQPARTREDLAAQIHFPPHREPIYAGFWLRFAALIVDYIIILVPFIVIFGVMGAVLGAMGKPIDEKSPSWTYVELAINILSILVTWLYYALMESSSQQATLGKIMIGLKVTDLDGGRLTFKRASTRYFGKIISGIILLIGYFMAGFTERKQALHDILAGCLVVRK